MIKINWNKFTTDFESLKSLNNVTNSSLKNDFRFLKNVSANEITSMGTGGYVSLLCEVENIEVLKVLLAYCEDQQAPFRFIGNGSNLVISDNGIDYQLVIKFLSKVKPIELPRTEFKPEFLCSLPGILENKTKFFRISAAQSMIGLSRLFSANGFSGFEFAAGIPGTVGGALRMNAGAHGNTISEVVLSVQVIAEDGTLKTYLKNDIRFEYRNVSLPKNYFIHSVDIMLIESEVALVSKKRKDALNYRKQTQPLKLPSAGSVFKNPSAELSAGHLLESVGLKGYRYGGIEFSPLHSNWLVKIDDCAKSADVRYLVDLGKQKVLETHGIELKEEIIFWD